MTTKKTQVIEVSIQLRKGTAEDFRESEWFQDENGKADWRFIPKKGQPYWVRSQFTGEFTNHASFISDATNWEEFKAFLRQDMVYVAVNAAWLEDQKIKETKAIT